MWLKASTSTFECLHYSQQQQQQQLAASTASGSSQRRPVMLPRRRPVWTATRASPSATIHHEPLAAPTFVYTLTFQILSTCSASVSMQLPCDGRGCKCGVGDGFRRLAVVSWQL